MTDGFIEARRVALERYLNRLAAHPAACRSEVGILQELPCLWLPQQANMQDQAAHTVHRQRFAEAAATQCFHRLPMAASC